MIWRRKDPAENHFVTFGHQETRIVELEADFLALSRALLDYVGEVAPMIVTDGSVEHLVDTLKAIIKGLEEPSAQK